VLLNRSNQPRGASAAVDVAEFTNDIEPDAIGRGFDQANIRGGGVMRLVRVAAIRGKAHLQSARFRDKDMIGPPKAFGRFQADFMQPAQVALIQKLAAVPLVIEKKTSVIRNPGSEFRGLAAAQGFRMPEHELEFVTRQENPTLFAAG